MSTVLTILAAVLLGGAILIGLAALTVSVFALLPLSGRRLLSIEGPLTLANATDLWNAADAALRADSAEWEEVTPLLRNLAGVATREVEASISQLAAEVA